jgi:hypothetical protein
MATPGSPPSVSKQPVDDAVLIAAFVQHLAQGQTLLLANTNLRIEPSFNTLQLLSKREGLLATGLLGDKPPEAHLRCGCSYGDLIHQHLLGSYFFPMPSLHKGHLHIYQYRTVPDGYTVHYTSGKEFWRAWWGRGSQSRLGLSMELLILSQGPLGRQETWHPVRNIELRHGVIAVRMLAGEVVLQPTEQVVWLKKAEASPADQEPSPPQIRPDLRGYYSR